jgi:hypothetical protein
MNKTQKGFFAFTLLAFVGQVSAECGVTSYYSIRSQGVNAARDQVGWEEYINQCDKECFYGAAAVTFDYSQTFRGGRICDCLFGNNEVAATTTTTTNNSCSSSCDNDCNDDCNDCSIVFSGSCVANRGAGDWFADYFGLPTDFQSTVTFSPRIQNFVADLQFYAGLDEWVCGLWFRLDLPIAHTKWNLRACETSNNTATLTGDYPAGYFAPTAVDASTELLSNALAFFNGAVPTITGTGVTPAVTFDPLRFGKWSPCSLTKTRLADVAMTLGYNFVCTDCGYFGLSVRATAPTGNRPEGEFLFEPIVGNGHHWTLGVGLNAHYVLWRSQCSDASWSFYLDANIDHMFKACQTRTFDLCENGAMSRYMLAQKLQPSTTLFANPAAGTFVPANVVNKTFANEFSPVANLTASNVDVKVSVQGDVSLKFAYQSECGLTWDLGYNFWGKACEKMCPNNCNQTDLSLWALKGDAYVYGFNGATPVALGATESKATINRGTGTVAGNAPSCHNSLNTGIDARQFAFVAGPTIVTDAGLDNQTTTSFQPITLDTLNVNYSSNRGISNKVFSHLSYAWKGCEDWMPFFGVGVAAEFGQKCGNGCGDSDDSCASSCDTGCSNSAEGSCVSCAISQWSVWIKGGVVFN